MSEKLSAKEFVLSVYNEAKRWYYGLENNCSQ